MTRIILRKFALSAAFAACFALPATALAANAPAPAKSAAKQAEAHNGIEVSHAWARAMLPGAKVGAGYFEIKNNSATALRLFSVQSPVAEKVEIHSMSMENNVMKMRELGDGIEIPAHSGLSFMPGSYHLMFINPKEPLKAGQSFKARFKFTNGQEMEIPFTVRAANAKSGKAEGKAHMSHMAH